MAIKDEVEKLLKAKFIKEVSHITWLANIVMVKKANDSQRMCVDFIDLNKACAKDSYPLPNINNLLDITSSHTIQSFYDIFSRYNQILMWEEDCLKVAFIIDKGIFYYKMMPFGSKNTRATYQKMMNTMFKDQISRNLKVYINDMLIKSKSLDDYLTDLEENFIVMKNNNVKINPAKCVFGVIAMKFLGFILIERGIEMNPTKCNVILERSPTTMKEV